MKKKLLERENEIEKLLNQELIKFFTGYTFDYNPYLQYKFIFMKDDENKGTNYKPDIGVTIWNNQHKNCQTHSFFQIECKRLPIPNVSSTRSEKEYVIGIAENTGGIERFKNKKHGEHLEESSLIGFIQNETINNWFTRINEWIKIEVDNKNANWTNEDYLVSVSDSTILNRYSSLCHREDSQVITIHHFLINIQ
ncbi:MAG: hypothetical protein K2Q03_09490 [Sphingobacteriaceae bacterium]|nr:hypothetical protein [Sphingobacteriaceae bacterium]